MAEANPPTNPPSPPTPIWHGVVGEDDRLLDWDVGASTQAHLTATRNANSGSEIRTFTGDPPANVWVGMQVGAGGVITPPMTENDNEELAARKDKVEQWILANIPTRGFLAYHSFVDRRRADIFEAWSRRTYFNTLVGSILSNDAYWAVINSHTDYGWARFCRMVDLDSWDAGGNSILINSLRSGSTWRDIGVDAATGLFTAHAQSDSHNWPATYIYDASHTRAYEDLIASVRVL